MTSAEGREKQLFVMRIGDDLTISYLIARGARLGKAESKGHVEVLAFAILNIHINEFQTFNRHNL